MGLHVAALALKRDGTASPVRARMMANQSLSSYLIEDILAHEDPAILEFLLTVSVLDRLCLPLCEALADSLSGQLTARDCLNWLVNSNFLIVPLDEEGTWYRLHRLLKEAMRQRAASQYGDAQVRAWRRRAADWFEQQGMIAEGLRQAVALGDLDLAARLVESGFVEALNREDRPTIDQWLKLFPDSFIAQRPSLLVVQAVSQQMAWRLPLLKKSLDAFDALCARQPNAPTSLSLDALRGIVRVFRAQFAYSQNNMAISEACARNALEMIPESWENGRGGAIIYFAAALQAMGRFQEAETMAQSEYLPLAERQSSYVLRLLMSLIAAAVNDGQLDRASQFATVMVDKASKAPLLLMRGWAQYWKGAIEFEWGLSVAASEAFAHLTEMRLTAHSHAVRNSFIGLALLQAERGHHSEANATLSLLSQYDVSFQGMETNEVRGLRAWLTALHGDLAGALRWADSWDDPVPNQPLIWLLDPHLVRARLLILRGRPDDLRTARSILAELDRLAIETHSVRYQIHVGVAKTLCHDAGGDVEAALDALNEASAWQSTVALCARLPSPANGCANYWR